jgi:hypothetical protein
MQVRHLPDENEVARTEHFWNDTPVYLGLYDHLGRARPAYWSFKLMGLLRGTRLAITGGGHGVRAFAARNGRWDYMAVWSFPRDGQGAAVETAVRVAGGGRAFRLVRLNPEAHVNNLELKRQGTTAELEKEPLRFTVKPFEVWWIEIGR